jgi:DNA-binding transcriptional LysR family regulator
MMVDLHRLASFAAVAELGSFTRAAERLDLTQAAVSQHVQKLEAELGALLIRRRGALELTPAGHALMDFHRETLAASGRLAHRLTAEDADRGEISLITPGSIGLALYPCLLDMQQASLGLSIRHRFAPTHEIVEAVASNAFEIGLASLRPDDPRLHARQFAQEPLELVVPAGARIEAWEDLASLGFIDHPDGIEMASRLLSRRYPEAPSPRTLTRRGFTNQVALILEPVSRGLGFTVIPRYARQAFARQDLIRVLPGPLEVIDTIWLLHRVEWPMSARAARAVAALETFIKGLEE